MLGGGVVLALFLRWETPAASTRGEGALLDPAAAAQRPAALRGDLVPVHVPRAGGDVLRRAAVPVGGARAVGDRDRRAAAAAVAHAAAVRRGGPEALRRTPTRGGSSTLGFLLLFAGLVLLVACSTSAPGRRSSPGRCCSSGPGLGAMASQLGSVTVSAVPDEQSGEVGGLQNTGTQLGASIGTALAGAMLISALTAVVLQRHPEQPGDPRQPRRQRADPARDRRALRVRRGPAERARRRERPARDSRRDRRRERRGAGSRACARPSRCWRSSASSPCCSPAASRRSNPAPRPSRTRRRARARRGLTRRAITGAPRRRGRRLRR